MTQSTDAVLHPLESTLQAEKRAEKRCLLHSLSRCIHYQQKTTQSTCQHHAFCHETLIIKISIPYMNALQVNRETRTKPLPSLVHCYSCACTTEKLVVTQAKRKLPQKALDECIAMTNCCILSVDAAIVYALDGICKRATPSLASITCHEQGCTATHPSLPPELQAIATCDTRWR